MQSALACLSVLARHHGVDLDPGRLAHDFALDDSAISAAKLRDMAAKSGLKAKIIHAKPDILAGYQPLFPLLARRQNGEWCVLVGVIDSDSPEQGKAVAILDPANATEPGITRHEWQDFIATWSGEMIALKKIFALNDSSQPFGLRWFIPEMLRQGTIFRDVFIAAIALVALGLVTPFFFQLVIDRVLTHHSVSTLFVLTIGAAVALLFESIFGFLRRYLTLFAANRMDIRVSTQSFSHLLGLPLDFFAHASAGVLSRHMQQGQKVREFLTGRLFSAALDSLSLIVFLPILLLYSVPLTLVVLGFAALIGAVIAILIKPFNQRLQALYAGEGERQAQLVESIHGIATIKALAMEPKMRRQWDDQSAQVVTLNYHVGVLSISAQAIMQFLEKSMLVAVIAIGAHAVFSGSMTIGALVAFQMLANRVSQPLVALVALAHEYQEAALAAKMLGVVMNAKPERPQGARGLRPLIRGGVRFEDVTFRYDPTTAAALDGVSFEVEPGMIFGIVGRSGSGKTTVTKLVQGLYAAQSGIVRVDGVDVRELDLVHLRRHIGVVLQENFLFRGTVRENIALAKPDAAFEEIVEVCRIAGALEFIERLPKGFDTLLEENGRNLSGGQKQRLAIARALINRPPVLVLDEATSALDPDSEAIIQTNLKAIAAGRTLLIVSHRLSTLTECDRILVLERGKIADFGRHGDLLSSCATYRHLWQQQNRNAA